MTDVEVPEMNGQMAAFFALIGLQAIVAALHDAKLIDGADVAARLELQGELPPGVAHFTRLMARACRQPEVPLFGEMH